METTILPQITEIINEYLKNTNFILTCLFTWLVCEAIFDIDIVEKFINGFKKVVALVIGGVIGYLIIESSISGAIAGVIPGGITTYLIGRFDKWFRSDPTV